MKNKINKTTRASKKKIYRPITKKAQLVLKCISDEQMKYGITPSIREIGDNLKISSPSVVSYYLSVLEKNVLIARQYNKARAILITPQGSRMVNDMRSVAA